MTVSESTTTKAFCADASSGDRAHSSFYSRYYPKMVSTYHAIFPNAPLCFTGWLPERQASASPIPGGLRMGVEVTVQNQRPGCTMPSRSPGKHTGKVNLFIIWNVDYKQFTPDPRPATHHPAGRKLPACDAIAALASASADNARLAALSADAEGTAGHRMLLRCRSLIRALDRWFGWSRQSRRPSARRARR